MSNIQIEKVEFSNPLDNRNVADEFKGMPTEEIKSIVDQRRFPAVNIAMNLTNDFNKASVLRANEAFCFQEFILINRINPQDPLNPQGIKRFDSRGTVGMKHYANIRHSSDWKSIIAELKSKGYTIYAVDNISSYNPISINKVQLPEKTAFFYGEEQKGLSNEIIEACDTMIYIPQYGVPRSLNIAQAAAICMNEYTRQHTK